MSDPWWKSAVVYQIYPRSFADANGDGVGDLQGIRSRLDHLAWLGVDAIWLSPFYRSPMADFGYDVSDYCDVDPLFGTLADFDALVADAHDRGIKVIVDWVPNHTSDQHPWFTDARSSVDAEKRDWYYWREQTPDGAPPNNWIQTWTDDQPTWTVDPATDQWYLHLFLPQQPDLNWRNPEVVAAMHDVLRFWLDRGVDGFRMDVLHALGKHPDLVDDAAEMLPIPHSALNHHESTYEIVRGLRSVLEEYPGDRMMVGEIFLLDTSLVASYYDGGQGLHLAFNFPPLFTPWHAGQWRYRIEEVCREIEPQGWPSWVLSNHDQVRHRTRYGSEARARAATVLLLGLRGTPFLYAGEELGMDDAVVPPERVVDPGGRDGCRAPVPWTPAPDHGWGTTDPWLPWAPESEVRNAESLVADEGSILHLYRRFLAERRTSPALQLGDQVLLDGPADVVAWDRTHGDDRRRLVVNFSDEAVPLGELAGGWVVAVATDGVGAGEPAPATAGPGQGLVLRPA
ncbi:MAG TPA: alpha-amylase family glycosyl hydrolase [Aquihabitans sp.]|jgi:alpha-glucosidase|nr:alpha-amylase family glycosyl hydrolase [Aquihabitans sp.]